MKVSVLKFYYHEKNSVNTKFESGFAHWGIGATATLNHQFSNLNIWFVCGARGVPQKTVTITK